MPLHSISSTFDVSAAGMAAERLRADVAAANLANMHTTRTARGGPWQPLRAVVVAGEGGDTGGFAGWMESTGALQPRAGVEAVNIAPRRVHEPLHPDADAKGFVDYPHVDHLGEMVTLMQATRAYEANVAAFKSARTMALKALEIGGR